MDEGQKIFTSTLKRRKYNMNNDLEHFIKNKKPAKPVTNREDSSNFNHSPTNQYNIIKTDKYFIPKPSNKKKVKTLRDIRMEYQAYIYNYLPSELEKQRQSLYKQIKKGLLTNSSTKKLAKQILRSDEPVTRFTWQMITNVNPEDYPHSVQYVLLNGSKIRVGGSMGGSKKYISDRDLGKNDDHLKKSISRSTTPKNISLLQNSSSVKFKPGPLSRKKNLIKTNDKFIVGNTELIHLPNIGIEIEPIYGVSLEPIISKFFIGMREERDVITKKWAEFAVSALGTLENNKPIKCRGGGTTFTIKYKNDQKRILMRDDTDWKKQNNIGLIIGDQSTENDCYNDQQVIKTMLEQMVHSVQISINESDIPYGIDDKRTVDDNMQIQRTSAKERSKVNNELQRLDVTVIKLSETTSNDCSVACRKPFCRLGCVCTSLLCEHNFKSHCRRQECMFQCNCTSSEYNNTCEFDNLSIDMIHNLITLDNKIKSRMSKEEQKFHQTVMITGDSNVLLNSRKRKATKCAEQTINVKDQTDNKPKEVSVVISPFKCDNLQTWCMVHELYNCFCKGRIVESFVTTNTATVSKSVTDLEQNEKDLNVKHRLRKLSFETKQNCNKMEISTDDVNNLRDILNQNIDNVECSRTKPYMGRKFDATEYLEINKKISEIEVNDGRLLRKLLSHLNYDSDHKNSTDEEKEEDYTIPGVSKNNVLLNKDKIEAKIDKYVTNYEHIMYSENRFRVLDSPTNGKVAIYPSELLISRYREKKNNFLVTKTDPKRIFICLEWHDPFFKDCININDIRFVDLHKYPLPVQNLLTNAKDSREKYFILCGLPQCWELTGSLSLKQRDNKNLVNESDESSSGPRTTSNLDSNISEKSESNYRLLKSNTSKWFQMSLENDFSDLLFFNKGFFVTSNRISKCLNCAKESRCTVKLTDHVSSTTINTPQFGIYAVPSPDEPCLLVGPYEIDEELGITTSQNNNIAANDIEANKITLGRWLYTKKVDNEKLIFDPLSFMSNANSSLIIPRNDQAMAIQPSSTINVQNDKDCQQIGSQQKELSKVIKPIKIQKDNMFFYFDSDGKMKQRMRPSICRKTSVTESSLPEMEPSTANNFSTSCIQVSNLNKPNISSSPISGTTDTPVASTSRSGGVGMCILKPKEINSKIASLIKNNSLSNKLISYNNMPGINQVNNDMEKEMIPVPSVNCNNKKTEEVYVISDDEGSSDVPLKADYVDIFIESNIANVGNLHGRRNGKDEISFKFPGFQYTDFYKKNEAFLKINQILSAKCLVPQNIHTQWRIVENERDLKNKSFLKLDTGTDYVPTNQRLVNKAKLKADKKLEIRSELNDIRKAVTNNMRTNLGLEDLTFEAEKVIEELEKIEFELEE